MRVWRSALRFHVGLTLRQPLLLPLLCVPVFGDALHAVLIGQQAGTGAVQGSRAIREAWDVTPALLGMKLRFELPALAWSLVPIYGLIQGMRHRLYWAMASNVLVFEGLKGAPGAERCRALVDGDDLRLILRTLVIVPAVILVLLLVFVVMVVTFSGLDTPATVTLYVLALLWVLAPGSAAANTFLYLTIAPPSVGADASGRSTRAGESRAAAG